MTERESYQSADGVCIFRPVEFRHAIVKTPCANLALGLTSADLGPPDYHVALAQHRAYVNALRVCGLSVTILEPDDKYPDSTFVEDAALLYRDLAIITRPGAESRRGETDSIESALGEEFKVTIRVTAPGTVDAGDIMMVDAHFFIGLSERTNAQGAGQIIEILAAFGCTGSTVPLSDVLHLKSAVSYLENNNLIATPRFADIPDFKGFNILRIPDDEQYAANCLWLNGTVLVAAGYPKTKSAIQTAVYETIELDMSEFRKLDGGLSCLSLRY
jgi:dimethylargininase